MSFFLKAPPQKNWHRDTGATAPTNIMSVNVTVWGPHGHGEAVVAVDRQQLREVSRFIDGALGSVDLRDRPGVRVTEEHIALLLHHQIPPDVCTIPRFQEMVAVCASLDVPPDVRQAIGAHMASARRIPLLRIAVHDDSGGIRHQHDIMLAGSPHETNLLRKKYTDQAVWTLDPALGYNEVHNDDPRELRVVAYHALRDVLDVGLQLDAMQPMFDLVSEWARRNAFMFVDDWVGDLLWDESHDCHVDFDSIAPTVRVQPDQIVALMRFALQLTDDATTAGSDYNSDDYRTSFTYSETDMAHVKYMDPPAVVCDDPGTAAPRHVIRFERHVPPPPRHRTARKSTGEKAGYRRLATAPPDAPIVGRDAAP